MTQWIETEGRFKSWDGEELFYRAWEPEAPGDKALIVIHRGHEHSGRVAQQVKDLGLEGVRAFSWDCRGHGRSPGDRGYAEHYYDLVRDLDAFVTFVCATYGLAIENLVVVANSVGAVTAAAWVHDFAPRIRAMVLAAPAFRIKLYVPFAIPSLRLLQKFKKGAFVTSYVKSRMLTHDPEQARSYDEDVLITRRIAVNVLLGLHDTATRLMADAGAIDMPTLVLSAGSDWVVKTSAERAFFDGLSSRVKQMQVYSGFYHALLYEKGRHKPLSKAREFILEAFEWPVDRASLLTADQDGYTRDEYERLRELAPPGRALGFAFQQFLLRTVGMLSRGIRLGWETGFDSGRTLDYVYENEANGTTRIGRLIDRYYLDMVGWKGIRERGSNLKACLAEAIVRAGGEDKPVRIMDVAAGVGRYVLDVLKDHRDGNVSALLCDRDPRNLDAARAMAEALGLDNVTFQEGDAFNTESLLAVEPRPDIAIVSGLFELFPENAPILASLEGMAGALGDEGILIYTCQPWHPQVELIARTLINRNGEPWIMRRRTQAEMDELVRSVGFEKVGMRGDRDGIFTVSVARRRRPDDEA